MVLAPVGAATLLRRLAQFVFCLLFLSAGSVRSEPFSTQDILASAKRSLVEGRVLESMGTLDKAFRELDPKSQPEEFLQVGFAMVEYLSFVERHDVAAPILQALVASQVATKDQAAFQWMQFYLGRNLAYLGELVPVV